MFCITNMVPPTTMTNITATRKKVRTLVRRVWTVSLANRQDKVNTRSMTPRTATEITYGSPYRTLRAPAKIN